MDWCRARSVHFDLASIRLPMAAYWNCCSFLDSPAQVELPVFICYTPSIYHVYSYSPSIYHVYSYSWKNSAI